ncbi:uncharacterized protein K441DRAFT_676128 [Cenococcum geophilum 1.58]|uniref:uncharacterized protein n=1 Tax=Cenococcum geophilum 1.58 TaxID=794803 RepID=UPI00358FB0C6|nr:hypothetical protein K441DRAFT_676128 [Cenococcum geophilum 1.58]
MASQSSKRPSEEPHYTQGPAKRLHRATPEPLLGLPAPANAPSITPPSTPPSSSSDTPATNISSPVCPATPETPSKAADQWVPTTEEVSKMSLEEIHAYMRLRGWEIHIWDFFLDDSSPDIEYEDALYQQGLGKDSGGELLES